MNRKIGFVAVLLTIGLAMHGATAHAAEPLKAGDTVEVLFLNEWRPAVVVKPNLRGMVVADFEFAGAKQREAFPGTAVRLPYEAGALSRPRSRTDSAGKPLGRAVVASIDGENVTLRKPDMSEATLPIASLGKNDQDFLKPLITKIEKTGVLPAPAKAPPLPPAEQFAPCKEYVSSAAATAESEKRPALTPDPLPKYLLLQPGSAACSTTGFFDEVAAVFAIGGKDSLVLAALEEGMPGRSNPTRLLWASLTQRKIVGQQLLPPAETVLDYFPSGHRLLTYRGSTRMRGGNGDFVLTLWEVLPTDRRIDPIVSWNTHSEDERMLVLWARLASKDIVVQRLTTHEIVAWDAAGKKMAYRTKEESAASHAPTLSPGRKYLFLPEDRQVRVLESTTGKTLLTLPADQATAAAIADDGRRAAVLSRETLTVWNLTDPNAKPQTCRAGAIGSFPNVTLDWVDDDRLMLGWAGSLSLYSLRQQRVIWRYLLLPGGRSFFERRTSQIVAGHIVFAQSCLEGTTLTLEGPGGRTVLTVEKPGKPDELTRKKTSGKPASPRLLPDRLPNSSARRTVISAAKLPGPKVDETVAAKADEKPAAADRELQMILAPGRAVRLEVSAGADKERVQAALERKIQTNGWKLGPTAPVVIRAEIVHGQPQQVTCVPEKLAAQADEKTVTITPEISRVNILVSGEPVWASSTPGSVPPRIALRAGETPQSVAAHWQKPNVAFFDSLEIPARIGDPSEEQQGLGTTIITPRGLIPQ